MSAGVELTAGAARCLVLPGAGGSLGGWWLGDTPLLRPAPRDATEPTALAGFPLVPFSNRIDDGRFDWAGAPIRLPPAPTGEPHALHGVGWRRPWQIADQAADRVVLELAYPAGPDWPWPFTARQEIALTPNALTLGLSARNDADQPVPLAIGHHPYFVREQAWLQLSARQVWLAGPTNLPVRAVPPTGLLDLSDPADAATRAIDHCYEGVAWPARVGWHGRDHALSISASPSLPCAVVYSSKANAALCIEPVAHVSNALNRPDAPPMPIVAPGDSFRATITMQIVAA